MISINGKRFLGGSVTIVNGRIIKGGENGKHQKFDEKKMADFGFKSDGDGFLYTQNIKDDQFELYFRVNSAKDIETSLVDRMSGEPYTLYLVEDAEGTFVGEVREAYESALNEIAANCCNDTYFTCQQSNRITELIYDKYRDTPEFLWEKFPGHGVFRNPLSRKWYGVILRVSGEKLDKKLKSEVEVLNIKFIFEINWAMRGGRVKYQLPPQIIMLRMRKRCERLSK